MISVEKDKAINSHYDKLVSILGKQYIHGEIESPFDYISSKGINPQIIQNFRTHFNISRVLMAALLNTSEATIYRWISSNKPLERNYSIQLFELTDLFLFGFSVFESRDNFFKWLDLPNTVLGGMKPIELLKVSNGISKVRDLLGRIEYGVYS